MDEAGPAANLTAYYAAQGTPPGRFLGAGLADLGNGAGVDVGSHVTEEQLWRMLGMLQDPLTGEPLGSLPPLPGTIRIGLGGRVRPAPKPVAGFDLTFSVPKSVSVAWALADEGTKAVVHTAHRDALAQVLTYAEEHVIATRTGRGGIVSAAVTGVVAAAFDHWDSRATDPQLHTHVVVLNRARTVVDGRWRALDGATLLRHAVDLSELYNGLLADELTRRLGWAWTPELRPRGTHPICEVDGVPADLRALFSQRSTQLGAAKDAAVEAFERDHGRAPTPTEVVKLRQVATLATRPAKAHASVHILTNRWRGRAADHVPVDAQEDWVASLAGRNETGLVTSDRVEEGMLRDTATVVLAQVGERRATFTRANLLAEAFRQIQGVRFATAADRIAIAERVATQAVERAVRLSPQEPRLEPVELRRPDGTSRLRPVNSARYATAEIVAAEDHLLAAGRDLTGPRVDPALVDDFAGWAPPGSRHPLTSEQAYAVAAVVTSGRTLDVLVGAAGTGKSTTMAAVVAAWESAHGSGSVTGLAPSAAAADVLADAVGIPTENTAKWISENRRAADRDAALDAYEARLRTAYPSVQTRALQKAYRAALAEHNRWILGPRELVIVDEASLAGTLDLHQITGHAQSVGAKVLLVGDHAQMSPVAAGGAFRLVADARGHEVSTLTEVHRFTHDWEAEASLDLRRGRSRVAKTYLDQGRVESGPRDDVLDRLLNAWQADTAAGTLSLMVAGDAATVADLNTRARARRVAGGHVAPRGVRTSEGVQIGVGDVIVTRPNRRVLAAGTGWVKNGDDWIVTATAADGSLTVIRPDGTGRTVLPADYASENVDLGYATTTHRAQGRTVDTTHAYVSMATTRESLYVMATRGRDSNRLYVDGNLDYCEGDIEPHSEKVIDAVDVLRHAIATSAADQSAHDTESAELALAAAQWRLDAEAAVRRRARELGPGVRRHAP